MPLECFSNFQVTSRDEVDARWPMPYMTTHLLLDTMAQMENSNHFNGYDMPYSDVTLSSMNGDFGFQTGRFIYPNPSNAFTSSMENNDPNLRFNTSPTGGILTPNPVNLGFNQRVYLNESCTAKQFQCTYPGCGKLFKRTEHLKRHLNTVHTDFKPFVCRHPQCHKRFSRSDNLSQHLRTHRPKPIKSHTGSTSHQ
ncbi:hypothetical protein L0F63_007056 [Massospora cicadina]|nr:hypothetical protein L0F63_007056 [Massospora cicadina]